MLEGGSWVWDGHNVGLGGGETGERGCGRVAAK